MPRWSKEAIDYFESNWGVKSLESISKHLNKSADTIEAWRKRHGYPSSREASGYISVNDFAIAVNKDPQTIYRGWIRDNNMPVKRFKPGTTHVQMMINIDDFWKWAVKKKHFIDFSIIEPGIFGKEPEWVYEQRKRDFKDNTKKGWARPWTKQEDAALLNDLKLLRYTYRQLTEKLNRSSLGIQIRLAELGIKYRPIPEERKVWSDADIEKLLKMYNEGNTLSAIGKELDRTEIQVKTKIQRIKSSSGAA